MAPKTSVMVRPSLVVSVCFPRLTANVAGFRGCGTRAAGGDATARTTYHSSPVFYCDSFYYHSSPIITWSSNPNVIDERKWQITLDSQHIKQRYLPIYIF